MMPPPRRYILPPRYSLSTHKGGFLFTYPGGSSDPGQPFAEAIDAARAAWAHAKLPQPSVIEVAVRR